jgi:hypothetical protein
MGLEFVDRIAHAIVCDECGRILHLAGSLGGNPTLRGSRWSMVAEAHQWGWGMVEDETKPSGWCCFCDQCSNEIDATVEAFWRENP